MAETEQVLEIDDQDIPALVREKLGIEYLDVMESLDVTTTGGGLWGGLGIKSRWRLRVQISLVDEKA